MHVTYNRDACIEDDDNFVHDHDILNRINGSKFPPHHLPLRIGNMIILVKNLDICNGHCIGTSYVISNLSKNLREVEKRLEEEA